MERNKIYCGNNLDILKTFPDNSIDSIVTDPPYGLGKEPNALEVLQSWITTGYHEIKGKGFMGKEWDSFVPQPIFWKECLRVLKPGGYLLSFAGTRTYDWVVIGLRIAGFEIRDQIAWLYATGFPKSLDVSKAIDKKLGAERKVIDEITDRRNNGTIYGLGHSGKLTSNIPETAQAKQWQGWGTALKPALEPIVMARKPIEGTVAENVLKYGTGAINIDGCRVGDEEIKVSGKGSFKEWQKEVKGFTQNEEGINTIHNGRFPANVIHDGSEEVMELFLNDEETSSARFFYTPKASQTERNLGLYEFDKKYTASAEFRPNHMEKALEGESGNPYGRWQPKKNIHPTVKPIDLMQYLVRLVTPKNGLCLDPYLGSGTTAVACKLEGFNYIGIELMPEYKEIAEARIAECDKDYQTKTKLLKNEEVKEVYDIFDFMESEK